MAELQRDACVGEKGVENVFAAKDGKCLCYDPPWDAGVPPPNEQERRTRPDFDGYFLCRANPGAVASSTLDRAYCPLVQPTAADACSTKDPMLGNRDCLYAAANMKTVVHFRCDAEHWHELTPAELNQQRMMRQ